MYYIIQLLSSARDGLSHHRWTEKYRKGRNPLVVFI